MILFEQCAGHQLLIEKVIGPRDRAHRPNFSSVPVSEGIEIRKGSQFAGSLVVVLVGSYPARLVGICPD